MIALVLAAALLAPSTSDYFPLVPGTKWLYEERVERMVTLQEDEVLAPVEVGGAWATPVTSSLNGAVFQTLYYRIVGDTVMLVAHDPAKPLTIPLPVLKVGDGRVRWEHTGTTEMADEPAPLTMKCESSPKGQREVLGVRRDVLELKVEAIVGGSLASIRNKQTALYAKGVGLVEMRGEGKVGPRTSKFERKLVRHEPGGGRP